MRKSLHHPKQKTPAAKERHSRWRMIIVSAACLSLLVTSWITAQQSGRRVTRRGEPPTRPTPVMAPVSLTPTAPAKEYIYAGGKLVATEEPTVFSDVAAGSQFYEEINKLAAKEVTLGCLANGSYPPPVYCPEGTNGLVTREQMAIFFMRAKGEYNPPTPATQWFSDVGPERVGYAFVEQMRQLGITAGCNPGPSYPYTPPVYCPDSSITHAQMAAFVCRANGLFEPPEPTGQIFCDVPPNYSGGAVFYRFIDKYVNMFNAWPGCSVAYPGNTLGCPVNCSGLPKFCPDCPVTRREMAYILVHAFKL